MAIGLFCFQCWQYHPRPPGCGRYRHSIETYKGSKRLGRGNETRQEKRGLIHHQDDIIGIRIRGRIPNTGDQNQRGLARVTADYAIDERATRNGGRGPGIPINNSRNIIWGSAFFRY